MLAEHGSLYSPGGLRKDCTEKHLKYLEFLEMQGYKLRYSGGFVPDINQVLIKRGGVFTYPALKKSPRGKLRLLFELQPMAFIIEQAGGIATDGSEEILSLKVEDLEACWDSAAENGAPSNGSPDVLSYDQAARLGFTPAEHEE